MLGRAVPGWKENLRILLDKVKNEDNTVYTQIPLFAENHIQHSQEIVTLIYQRIQNLDKAQSKTANEIKVKYYYILDAILKKKIGRYTQAFEEIVLPEYWKEMVNARSDETLLTRLAVLFVTWEGFLKIDLLLENLKGFYQTLRTFVIAVYLRTCMTFLEKIRLLMLRSIIVIPTSRDNSL